MKDQAQQFVLADHLARLDQAIGLRLGTDPLDIDAATVISDGDEDFAARLIVRGSTQHATP